MLAVLQFVCRYPWCAPAQTERRRPTSLSEEEIGNRSRCQGHRALWSETEKSTAEDVAHKADGVKSVKNQIAVLP